MIRLFAIAHLHKRSQCDQRREAGAGAAPDIRGEISEGAQFAFVDVVPVACREQNAL
ncbi:hypothetical protein [Burkholderia ubonensis]|uniref:hypothetical protein n=1 Tax=Burkholderia ubonensis TaxID=101571 RepID=UPI0018DF89F8